MGSNPVQGRLKRIASHPASDRVRAFADRTAPIVFGDSLGLTVFIGALLFLTLYWRIGFVFNDNWAIANTFVAVSRGQLAITELVYGPPGVVAPGMHVVDGRWYGRNYGQVVLALPFLAAVELVSYVADLRIALAGGWSLLLLAFAIRIGDRLGDRDRFALLGSICAVLAFAANTAVALPIQPRNHHLLALQLSTIVAAALMGVLGYRLVAAIHDRRTGILVAAAIVLASPVAFWASLPKRHVLITLLALLVLFAFYVSRAIADDRTALWTRSAAYAAVGLAAWVHAAEALTLFIVLVPLDLATARSNAPRRLTVVAGVFLASLLPFFVTNQLIAGNPWLAPRFLWTNPPQPTPVEAGTPAPTPADGGTPAGGGTPNVGASPDGTPAPSGSDGGISLRPLLAPFVALFEQARALFTSTTALVSTAADRWLDFASRGVEQTAARPSNVYHTYIRSNPTATRTSATDLTLLETTPVFGLFAALPVLLVKRIRSSELPLAALRSPVRQTDALAVAFVLALAVFNLPRLPQHANWTVRHLLPMVPFGLYFVGRLPPVRRVVAEAAQLLAYAYAGLVLVGGQLLVVYLIAIDPTRGEVIQFHGLLGIAAATVVAGWAVLAALDVLDDARVGAVALAIPLATGTLYLLLTGLEYFVTGHFALGMSEVVSEAIPLF